MRTIRIKPILDEYRRALEKIYGPRLRELFLYGSYARGSADGESDLDLLVLLDHIPHYAAEIDRTSQVTADLSLRHGICISRVFLSENEWKQGRSPFIENLRDEAKAA